MPVEPSRINRDSPVPLYRQLYELLRSRIVHGELAADDVIPTEMDLVEQFGLSRVTVRRALEMLVDEGLILRQPGKGSFVSPHRFQENLSSLRGFAEMMLAKYPEHVMEILGFEVVTASQDVCQYLALDAGASVVSIRRRHVLNGVPLAYALIYLPLDIGGLFTPHDITIASIYSLIAQKTGFTIQSAMQTISAIPAEQELAALLAVPEDAPVLLVRRVTYSSTNRPLEYIRLHYPGERHELAMEVHRDSMVVFAGQDPLEAVPSHRQPN